MTLTTVELTKEHYTKISDIIYQTCGINLKRGKEALIRARLMKRLRAVGIGSVDAYLKYIVSDKGAPELDLMIDEMTTNKTGFFREAGHFNFLGQKILPELTGNRLRFWSAACSSGEEPFSLAITLKENMPDIDSRDCLILATDISDRMLAKARQAVYGLESLQNLPQSIIRKYFIKQHNGSNRIFKVKDNIRNIVRLVWLNLINPWPMKGPFNVIMCRNVMIYFDKPTQQQLIQRFWGLLEPGGYLLVGHSEGLAAISHQFRYIQPAIYQK
jgi:chemotaxis protein methyltransferase CheR